MNETSNEKLQKYMKNNANDENIKLLKIKMMETNTEK